MKREKFEASRGETFWEGWRGIRMARFIQSQVLQACSPVSPVTTSRFPGSAGRIGPPNSGVVLSQNTFRFREGLPEPKQRLLSLISLNGLLFHEALEQLFELS